MIPIVGLSGGIGSGKSTVSAMLDELGALIVDADAIVHELQAPGMPLLREIAEAFGEHMIDPTGALDRAALGDVVFRDPGARRALGEIMHPPVIAEMVRRTEQGVEDRHPLVVLDIPLLFEGKQAGTGSAVAFDYDALVAVWVPRHVQIARTMARDGCDEAEAERRVKAQLDIDEKRRMATHVIDNSGHLDDTREQVEQLYEELAWLEAHAEDHEEPAPTDKN